MDFIRTLKLALIGLVVAIASVAQSAITFSNVSMVFNPNALGTNSSYATGNQDIDFTTPEFKVGDFSFGPTRIGTLTISYEASSPIAMTADRLVLSALGGLSGSGRIEIAETIEDLANPGIIGSLPLTTITSSAQLPFVADITFIRTTTKLKATKEITIWANDDTPALDFARIGLIEQSINLVPEPASMVALGLGVVGLIRRRRNHR